MDRLLTLIRGRKQDIEKGQEKRPPRLLDVDTERGLESSVQVGLGPG